MTADRVRVGAAEWNLCNEISSTNLVVRSHNVKPTEDRFQRSRLSAIPKAHLQAPPLTGERDLRLTKIKASQISLSPS